MDGFKHKRLFGYTFVYNNTYNDVRDARILHDMVAESQRYNLNGAQRCSCTRESCCLEDCLNRANAFECDIGKCTPECLNNDLQRWEENVNFPPVTLKVDPGVGMFLYSTRSIAAQELVGEIKGRYETLPNGKEYIESFYAYELERVPEHDQTGPFSDRKMTLNTLKESNEFRFIQHSCKPNCYAYQVMVGVQIRIAVRASKDIPADQLITLDYGDKFFQGGLDCKCAKCVSSSRR